MELNCEVINITEAQGIVINSAGLVIDNPIEEKCPGLGRITTN